MLRAVLAGIVVFALLFATLRGLEWLYHKLRKTKDWSSHWGTWAFALLAGVYAVVSELGR